MSADSGLSKDQVHEKVVEIVREVLNLQTDEPKIAPESRFIEDLGAESLDMAQFVMSLEDEFQEPIEDEQLIANTVNDQRMLTYDPAKPVPMLGPRWELKFWWEPERERWAPVVPLVASTISFAEGGEASGSGGCNDYTVTYEGDLQIEKVMEATDTYAELPTLTFGPVAAQMAQCAEPEGVMEQEQGFFTALDSVAYYFKMGGVMLMVDAEGVPVLMFAAAS